VIPKQGHTLVGTTPRGNDRKSIDRLLARVSERFGVSTRVLHREGHPATMLASLDDVVLGADNVLLTGEAAGLISPSSFEGITYALQSALVAAQSLKAASPDVNETYRRLCQPICDRLSQQLRKSKVVFDSNRRREHWSSLEEK
ncbi:MAG: hypothetical protein ACOC58_04490, partial [Chloroflexota bacterium]